MSTSHRKSGRFIVLSAPSGAGKTTLLKRLLEAFPGLGRSISCTTRKPRAGERDGIDYFFVDGTTFKSMVRGGRFFEWEEVHGAFYGTPKDTLTARRREGKQTLFDIDVRGALNLKKAYPDTCCIFVLPPSVEVLKERLKGRKSESDETMRRRLENARLEMEEREKFDYVIMNDNIERAFDELKGILKRELSVR